MVEAVAEGVWQPPGVESLVGWRTSEVRFVSFMCGFFSGGREERGGWQSPRGWSGRWGCGLRSAGFGFLGVLEAGRGGVEGGEGEFGGVEISEVRGFV